MPEPIEYQITQDAIAILRFDLPQKKLNVLSTTVMRRLERVIQELRAREDVKAVVIVSTKDGVFIAGADIDEIKEIKDPKDGERKAARGQSILQALHDLNVPVIAAIDGVCLGGGTELALACHYRIASDSEKTKIGLPEVNLGILPGFGGTQRLPRLIGIQAALGLILSGRSAEASEALRIGLVDKVVPQGRLVQAALQWAKELGDGKRPAPKRRRGLKTFLLEDNPLGRRLLFSQAKKQVGRRTRGHYPAPVKAIEAVQWGLSLPLSQGLALEARFLGELVVTEICKNLISLFYLNESAKKDPGVKDPNITPAPITEVGVLGAGVMGSGIAQAVSYHDIPVKLKDIHHEAVAKGLALAREIYRQALKRGRMSEAELERKMALIAETLDYREFSSVDLVIEAVVEDLAIKQTALREFEKVTKASAIFATNTSSLSITELAAASTRPGQVGGMHFFNPVHRMPLVEVIAGHQTSDKTIATLVAFAKRLGKVPIVVKECPGFLVNRILGPYLNEACLLLEEGNRIEEIDRTMLDFGMPMGPFRLLDEVGIDVADKVQGILERAFGHRLKASEVLPVVYQADRLGKKTNRGFYLHAGRKTRVDAAIYHVLAALRKGSGGTSPEEMQERMVWSMINEASRILEEGIVRRAADVDLGMVVGTGFPPFRGGLLKFADRVGIETVVERLEDYHSRYGRRFEPAELLRAMAKQGETFY